MIATCDRLIAAPIDLVWQLVTTPDGLNEWMSVEATIDLRVGESVRWVHNNGRVVAGFTAGWLLT